MDIDWNFRYSFQFFYIQNYTSSFELQDFELQTGIHMSFSVLFSGVNNEKKILNITYKTTGPLAPRKTSFGNFSRLWLSLRFLKNNNIDTKTIWD